VSREFNKYVKGINLKESWGNKAVNIMKSAILLSDVDVHKTYDLYKITVKLVDLAPIKSKREVMGINTTGEIMRCIEWMKKNEMI
jgi:stress response protein YsnF